MHEQLFCELHKVSILRTGQNKPSKHHWKKGRGKIQRLLKPKRWTKQAGWISNMIPIFHWRFLESNDNKKDFSITICGDSTSSITLGTWNKHHPKIHTFTNLSPNLQISRPLNQKILAASHDHCSSYLQPEWIVTSGRSLHPCLWVHAIARSFQVGPRSVSM